MRRKLGIFESAQTLSDIHSRFNAVGILRLSQGPSEETLKKSLNILQERHPLLRARILEQGKNFFFVFDVPSLIPLKTWKREREDTWRSISQEKLNTNLDFARGPLLECDFLPSSSQDGRSEIILTFHHSIIDAASASNIFHELLLLCGTDSSQHEKIETERLTPIPPEEKFFPKHFRGVGRKWHSFRFILRQIADEIRYRSGIKGKKKTAIHLTGSCRILTLKLSPDLTNRLIRRSRRERISMNSVLNAAMIGPTVEALYAGQDMLVRYFAFGNLRPYLKPPVAKENLGSFHTMVRFTIPYTQKMDFWELGHRINHQVFKASKRGDKFISAVLSKRMMQMIIRMNSQRMGTTALSYPGVIQISPSYGSIKVLGIHAFVSNFPLGPEYTCSARIFNRELYLDFLYLDSDMNQETACNIAEKIRAILTAAAG